MARMNKTERGRAIGMLQAGYSLRRVCIRLYKSQS